MLVKHGVREALGCLRRVWGAAAPGAGGSCPAASQEAAQAAGLSRRAVPAARAFQVWLGREVVGPDS